MKRITWTSRPIIFAAGLVIGIIVRSIINS